MSETFPGFIPPVSFSFTVSLPDEDGPAAPAEAVAFQEVSGISLTVETEEIKEGGENRFQHRVPGSKKRDNLVLKRGLMARSSALAAWCQRTLTGDLTQRIEPRTLVVSLQDANAGSSTPIMAWRFFRAFPTKWAIGPEDPATGDIVVESISFSYSYFEQV